MSDENANSGNTQTLDALWQEQSTPAIDINKISQKAASQRNKQRLYMFLDVLSLSPFILVLVLIDKTKYAGPIVPFFWFLLMSSGFMVAYFIKLRWLIAFSSAKTTIDYTKTLITQLKNNALIARINKHMTWLAGTLLVGFLILDGYMRNYSSEQLLSILWRSLVFTSLIMLPGFFWCRARQARFEHEASQLTKASV